MQLEADDLRRFGLEVRIIRGHVALKPVGPQGERARAPVGRTIGRLALAAPLQDPRCHGRCQRRGQLARMPAEQPRPTLSYNALTPTIDKAVRAVQLTHR